MINIILKRVNITHKRNPMENLDFQNFAKTTNFFTIEKEKRSSEEKYAKSHVVLAKEVTTTSSKMAW